MEEELESIQRDLHLEFVRKILGHLWDREFVVVINLL
jgi:hypothetical protein